MFHAENRLQLRYNLQGMLLVQETDLVENEHLILWRMHRRVYKKEKTGFEISIGMSSFNNSTWRGVQSQGRAPCRKGLQGQTGRQADRPAVVPTLRLFFPSDAHCSPS